MNTVKLTSIVNNTVKPLSQSNTIEDALNLMYEKSISSVVVTDDSNKPIGIFTEHDSLKIISNDLNKKIFLKDVMSKNVFYVKNDIYLHDAYILMEKHQYRHIIVVDEQQNYIGVVSEGDFIRHLGFEELVQTQTIKDIMSDIILTVQKETPLNEVTKLMSAKKHDYAVLMDVARPVGILTERDITHYCLKKDIDKCDVKASDIIDRSSVHIIDKNTSLQKAARIMENHGVHQVLITNDNDELVGLITRHDILKAIHGAYFDFLIKTIETKNENEKILLEQKQHLWEAANYDQLTGLPNRNHLDFYLSNILQKHQKDTYISLILLDINKFREINDSYGNEIGDEVLKQVSKKLSSFSDENSTVFRLGNNEFAVTVININTIKDMEDISNKIINEVQKTIHLSNGTDISLSSNIGISIYPSNSKNLKELHQHAATALHESKKNDVNTYLFYTNEMTKNIQTITSYKNRLKNAIKNGELELYFQPQIHVKTGQIVGAEALLRWNDKEKGLLTPDIFIPIAEESGLINPIGEWVIQETCKFGKKCLDYGHRLTLAVNVSANQMKYQNLPEIISKELHNSGFEADKLEIEITESSIMQRPDEAIKILHNIRALDVRIAIDDFGTGYSSLSYLKKFPIDTLKIDKSFIDDIPYSKDDNAIVIAIIEMGKALGYDVLAEGIETKEQLDFLEEKHCSLYQGFYKSEPLKADEFLNFL